jgi:hypothetical protein
MKTYLYIHMFIHYTPLGGHNVTLTFMYMLNKCDSAYKVNVAKLLDI